MKKKFLPFWECGWKIIMKEIKIAINLERKSMNFKENVFKG